MTSEQWDAMSADEQRVKVAELCGWSHTTNSCGTFWWNDDVNKTLPPEDDGFRECPDYLHDLNAMHEAERLMDFEESVLYLELLHKTCTATQRAKAFALSMEGE